MAESSDVAVVGDGVAGLTAALFAARHGLKTAVYGALGAGGGELLNIEALEDIPGFGEPLSGFEFCPALVGQVMNAGAAIRMSEVEAIEPDGEEFVLRTPDGPAAARTVIVASGATPRNLEIPGEERLRGYGVSHCASCDGPIYSGQIVGVVGGGDSALQEALVLARHAARVVLFHRGAALSAQETYVKRVLDNGTIDVRLETTLAEIVGDASVTGVRMRTKAGGDVAVDLNALFVYIGLEPRTSFLGNLVDLDPSGAIVTDTWMRTSRPGLFAAGIVRADSAGQAVSSAGDGATSAVAAYRHLAARGTLSPAATIGV